MMEFACKLFHFFIDAKSVIILKISVFLQNGFFGMMDVNNIVRTIVLLK